MKNGTATGNDHIYINTLIAGEDTTSKTLAKLYTKCLSERRIPTALKNAKMVIIFTKRNKKDLKNYSTIWLKVTKTSPVANIVSFVYKMSGMALLGI